MKSKYCIKNSPSQNVNYVYPPLLKPICSNIILNILLNKLFYYFI